MLQHGSCTPLKCSKAGQADFSLIIMAVLVQVAVYNYSKLQMLRAKASLSTTKDVEKQGGKELALGTEDDAPLLAADKRPPPSNGYTSFRLDVSLILGYNSLISHIAALMLVCTFCDPGGKQMCCHSHDSMSTGRQHSCGL